MIPRAAINMGYMRDAFKFDCAVHTGAAVDLGYDGGDRCVWQPFQIGEVITKVRSGDGWEDGKVQAIQLGPPRFVKVDISSSTPQAFQISEQIRAWNKEIGVETAWFGFDSTAAVGMTGIFQQDIGFDVIPVNHSGAVSSNKFRAGDELTPEFLVDRKVSEMWEATGIWLSEGQLRGLSETAVRELGIRKFDIMSGGKKRIQSKRQMRKEVGFSPDEGDAVCIVVEIVRHHGGQAGGLISGNQVASQNGGIPTAWQRMMQKFNNPNFGVGAQ
jgi:hypothetical protein